MTGIADLQTKQAGFFGQWVLWSAFVLAILGWGFGFYGPPVYLAAVISRTEMSLSVASSMVTVHFLFGALVIAKLPRLYRYFGLPAVTSVGAVLLALGVLGWSLAEAPWHLFIAALLTGGGWVTMGATAVNAIVSPWFVRTRPSALSTAYNGASIGGVILSPLWAVLIGSFSFVAAALVLGGVMVCVVLILSRFVFSKTPEFLGQAPDGDLPGTVPTISVTAATARPLAGRPIWRDRAFVTLAVGMALGLFAQIGLIAHLFSLMVPTLGAQGAGFAMGLATACAIAGRMVIGRMMPPSADRRLVACLSYGVQLAGSLILLASGGQTISLLLIGIVLFGVGIGNATSLPPLIAQKEFVKDDVQRVVSLIVAFGQASYAFAPAAFGLLRSFAPAAFGLPKESAAVIFLAAALIQGAAILCFLTGRSRMVHAE